MFKGEVQILGESVVFDAWVMYEIIKRLTTPFKDTKAYKLGIIDKEGKVLKKRSQLKTQEEREAFTIFDVFIFNLKKLIEKLPLGKTSLATYTAAFWLLKEWNNLKASDADEKILAERLREFSRKIRNEHSIQRLSEDTPANAVGSGNIAGAVPEADPPVRKKQKILRRRKPLAQIFPGRFYDKEGQKEGQK